MKTFILLTGILFKVKCIQCSILSQFEPLYINRPRDYVVFPKRRPGVPLITSKQVAKTAGSLLGSRLLLAGGGLWGLGRVLESFLERLLGSHVLLVLAGFLVGSDVLVILGLGLGCLILILLLVRCG